MTRSEMSYLDSVLIGPSLLAMNQYFNNFFQEYYVLWLCLVIPIDMNMLMRQSCWRWRNKMWLNVFFFGGGCRPGPSSIYIVIAELFAGRSAKRLVSSYSALCPSYLRLMYRATALETAATKSPRKLRGGGNWPNIFIVLSSASLWNLLPCYCSVSFSVSTCTRWITRQMIAVVLHSSVLMTYFHQIWLDLVSFIVQS